MLVYIIAFLLVSSNSHAESAFRIVGPIVLQDTDQRRVYIPAKEGEKFQVELVVEENIDEGSSIRNDVFILRKRVFPDDRGTYQVVGQKTEAAQNPEIRISATGTKGSYRAAFPIIITIDRKRIVREIVLRSPENLSAAIFDECNSVVEGNGGIGEVKNMQSDDVAKVIECFNAAESVFPRYLASETTGDIYDRIGNYVACENVFKRQAEFFRTRNRPDKYSSSVLRAALCHERRILDSDDPNEWGKLGIFVRSAFRVGVPEKQARVKLFRIWLDSFLKRASQSSDLYEIADRMLRDSDLKDEWIELFYQRYFWSRSHKVPNPYTVEQGIRDLKEISAQYSRYYDTPDGKTRIVPLTRRSQ